MYIFNIEVQKRFKYLNARRNNIIERNIRTLDQTKIIDPIKMCLKG